MISVIKKRPELLLLGVLVPLGLYLYCVAATLSVDTYDTFEIFLNARTIAGDPNGWYYPTRAYVFPIFLSPLFWAARAFAGDPAQVSFVGSHLVSMTLTCLLVWMTYRIFRVHLARPAALSGAALLALNPLIIHSAPISKEDIPGTLLTVTAFYFYLRLSRTGSRKHYALAALFILLSMGTRYNVMPLIPLVIAAHELASLPRGPQGRRRLPTAREFGVKLTALVLIPTALWLLIPTILYAAIGRATLTEAPVMFIKELYGATLGSFGTEMGYQEHSWENVPFLARSYSIPLLLVALWGCWTGWRKRVPGSLFHALWLWIFLAFHFFVLGHYEARYLFPFFPPLYFFAVVGLRDVSARARDKRLRATALAALLAWPAYNALAECAKFRDPFYSEHFERDVSRFAAELAGEHRVQWLGPFYANHPRDYVFDPEDEVTYLYHFFVHKVRFWTDRPMLVRRAAMRPYIPAGDPMKGVLPSPEYGAHLGYGDVVIMNLEAGPYVTKSVPAVLKPLVVERAIWHDFKPAGNGVYAPVDLPGATVEIEEANGVIALTAKGLPPGAYSAFAVFTNDRVASFGTLDTWKRPQLRTAKQNLPTDARIKQVSLLTFDSVKLFSVPSP